MHWGEVLCYLNDSTTIIYIVFSHWLQNMRFLRCLFVFSRLKGEIFSHLLPAIRPISSLNSRAKASHFAATWARDGERAFHLSSSPLSSIKRQHLSGGRQFLYRRLFQRTTPLIFSPPDASTPGTRHRAKDATVFFERATRHFRLWPPPSKTPQLFDTAPHSSVFSSPAAILCSPTPCPPSPLWWQSALFLAGPASHTPLR